MFIKNLTIIGFVIVAVLTVILGGVEAYPTVEKAIIVVACFIVGFITGSTIINYWLSI